MSKLGKNLQTTAKRRNLKLALTFERVLLSVLLLIFVSGGFRSKQFVGTKMEQLIASMYSNSSFTGDFAIIFRGEARQISSTQYYWRWIVETQRLDVFIMTHNCSKEKGGTQCKQIRTVDFQNIFGQRLKFCQIIEDSPYLVQDLTQSLRVAYGLVPRNVSMKTNLERSFVQHWIFSKIWGHMESVGADKSYKYFIVTRTDVVLFQDQPVYKSPNDTTMMKDLLPYVECKQIVEGNGTLRVDQIPHQNLLLYSEIGKMLDALENVQKRGISFTDVTFMATADALSNMSILANLMYTVNDRPQLEMAGYVAEGQFALFRKYLTNITDIRDFKSSINLLVIRNHGCDWRKPMHSDSSLRNRIEKSSMKPKHKIICYIGWLDPDNAFVL